jgi:23S rRNA (guanine745-N1)-methyltransferase
MSGKPCDDQAGLPQLLSSIPVIPELATHQTSDRGVHDGAGGPPAPRSSPSSRRTRSVVSRAAGAAVAMTLLACPVCRIALEDLDGRTFGCDAGHRFDRARDGSVDLLRPGRPRRDTGDDAEMVKARRAFLDRGRYDVLSDGLRTVADRLAPATVLDVGCGEGTFTVALCGAGREVVAFDLSKAGVRLAARRLGARATCCVAGVTEIPVLDRSCDLVTSVMSPTAEAEFLRVARPGGHVVVVSPGPDHLDGLRRLLYADYRPHDGEVPLSDRLPVVGVDRLRSEHVLSGDEARLVWAMTPYRWNAPAEGVERLQAAAEVAVTVDFVATTFALP